MNYDDLKTGKIYSEMEVNDVCQTTVIIAPPPRLDRLPKLSYSVSRKVPTPNGTFSDS